MLSLLSISTSTSRLRATACGLYVTVLPAGNGEEEGGELLLLLLGVGEQLLLLLLPPTMILFQVALKLCLKGAKEKGRHAYR